MTKQLTSIEDFIAAESISMRATRIAKRPDSLMSDTPMGHWRCTLSRPVDGPGPGSPKQRMTVYFSMGLGHAGREPEIAEVLDSLASDAASAEYDSFEGWARDMGYDEDSRQALRIYRACERIGERLERFLGADAAQRLKYEVERR